MYLLDRIKRLEQKMKPDTDRYCECKDGFLIKVRPPEECPEYLHGDRPRGCDRCGLQVRPDGSFETKVIRPTLEEAEQ